MCFRGVGGFMKGGVGVGMGVGVRGVCGEEGWVCVWGGERVGLGCVRALNKHCWARGPIPSSGTAAPAPGRLPGSWGCCGSAPITSGHICAGNPPATHHPSHRLRLGLGPLCACGRAATLTTVQFNIVCTARGLRERLHTRKATHHPTPRCRPPWPATSGCGRPALGLAPRSPWSAACG